MFFYGSDLSEFIEIAKCALKFSDFVPKAKQVFLRMINQGANQVYKFTATDKRAMKLHPIAFNLYFVFQVKKLYQHNGS